MNRRLLAFSFWIGLAVLPSNAATTPLFENNAPIFSAPVIDATAFINRSLFEPGTIISNVIGGVSFGTGGGVGIFTTANALPFDTQNTLYWTNTSSGIISGIPGFRFDYVKTTNGTTTRLKSSCFVNQGAVTGDPYLLISATNIISAGTLNSGPDGIIRLDGKSVDLNRAGLRAGSSPGTGFADGSTFNGGTNYFNASGISDLYWGAGTNNFLNDKGKPMDLTRLQIPGGIPNFTLPNPSSPQHQVFEGFFTNLVTVPGFFFFFNTNFIITNFVSNPFNAYVYTNTTSPTSSIVQVVFVSSNSLDATLSTDVHFIPDSNTGGAKVEVQFSSVDLDIVDLVTSTNYLYFSDSLGISTNVFLSKNIGASTKRPDVYEVDRNTPFDWDTNFFATVANSDLSQITFYNSNFQSKTVTNLYAGYAADLNITGVSDSRSSTLNGGSGLLSDPTNFPGRIEIISDQANLNQTRMRAQTTLSLKTKNLLNNLLATVDAPFLNFNLTSTNSELLITNLVPPSVHRMSGQIFAWSGSWSVGVTNSQGTVDLVTYHVLVLDNELQGKQTPTINEFAVKAGTNLIISDNLTISKSLVIDAEGLDIVGGLSLAPGSTWAATNILRLLNLTNEGILNIPQAGYFGTDRFDSKHHPLPYNNFINHGTIFSSADFIETTYFENTGTGSNLVIDPFGFSFVTNVATIATSGGLFSLSTATAFMSNAVLSASSDVEVHVDDFLVQDSIIVAGVSNAPGALIIYATNSLSDGGVGANNTWFTTAGFQFPILPNSSDLLNTTIQSSTTRFQEAQHICAGLDYGPSAQGFTDNLAVGRLILDASPFSLFTFSGVGHQNAIYVDYLEFTNSAFDFKAILQINPGMTIYFADSNLPAEKIDGAFNGQLRWVQDFAGPNSSKLVPLLNGGFAVMNRARAESTTIDDDCDGIPNGYDPYPLDGPCNNGTVPQNNVFRVSKNGQSLTLTLSTSGHGTVTPKLSAKALKVGSSYKLTAVPASGSAFAGWHGDVSSTDPKISFVLQSNTLLHASFVPNPFMTLKGAFNGLFYETDAVKSGSSGFFNLVVTDKGLFTGKLLIGRDTYLFHSQFDLNGQAAVQVPRKNKSALTMNLQLDVTTNHTDQVNGDITDGTWDATLSGDRAVFHRSAPQAGYYTMVLPGSDDAALSPGGDGFGMVTVDSDGNLQAKGRLADGVNFTQAVPISKNGQWPFYASLYGGKGALLSWVTFDSAGFSGDLSWIKTNFVSKYYPAGFVVEPSLVGSRYVPPTNHSTGLNLTNPMVILSGGNLSDAITSPVTLKAKQSSLVATNNNLILNLNPQAGSFTGKFVHPVTGASTPVGGVLLQNQNTARGYFLGTNQSGAVRLRGN